MKEGSAIEIHLPATESPIGSQQEVITKHFVFKVIQGAAADQAEVGYIILVLSHPSQAAILARAEGESHLAHVFFFGHAITEARVARAENCAQDAVAGSGLTPSAGTQSISMAVRTRGFRQRDSL